MKKHVKELLVLIIGVLLIVGVFVYINISGRSAEFDPTKDNDSFNFKLLDKDKSILIERDIVFTNGENLLSCLERNFDIKTRNDAGLVAILSIEGYESDWTSTFFSIYVDGKFSSLGCKQIFPEKGMQVEVRWEIVI